MALNPEDLSGGFQHYSVMAFINEKMARHEKGPEFYLENASLSWAEVKDKLRGVLEDSKMPSEAKEACAWSSLALGIRFNHRQGHLHASRVQQLYDFSKPQKSDAQTLASNLSEFKQRQEMNCKEVTYHLRLTQAKLEEVEKERDRLSWKLFRAVRLPHLVPAPSPRPAPLCASRIGLIPAYFSPGAGVVRGAGADRRRTRPGHCQCDCDRSR